MFLYGLSAMNRLLKNAHLRRSPCLPAGRPACVVPTFSSLDNLKNWGLASGFRSACPAEEKTIETRTLAGRRPTEKDIPEAQIHKK
jgi:hypothetical protein